MRLYNYIYNLFINERTKERLHVVVIGNRNSI